MVSNPGPGYQRRPDHRVAIAPAGERVRVTFGGEVIADSRDAIRLEETGYPPVYYLPRRDVKMARVTRTAHHTTCPWKGEASYFSLASATRSEENAAWSYETPYDEVAAIAERLAFYPDKVDAIAVG